MSKKREESAIDAIYQILDKLNLLDERIQVVDNNVKNLSNKVTKLNTGATSSVGARTPDPMPTSSDLSKPEGKVDRLVLGNAKVHGYIVNKAKRPIEGVTINVYDENNKLIKNILTNHDGYWEVRLPSGSYGVEYIHNKFRPINRTITVPEGSVEYEVR